MRPGTYVLKLTLILLLGSARLSAKAERPSSAAVAAFSSYTSVVEARLSGQHRSPGEFLPFSKAEQDALRGGELLIQQLPPPEQQPAGARIHAWRGSAFVPYANVADFERVITSLSDYPREFAPEVVAARVLNRRAGALDAVMRTRERHVLTVVLDLYYTLSVGQIDPTHGYSISRTSRVDELEASDGSTGHVLSPADAHGFLWALNTYWTYEQRDGGLYMQIVSISLTRSAPRGLGWAIDPLVESVPRDSLAFTLRAMRDALVRSHSSAQNTQERPS